MTDKEKNEFMKRIENAKSNNIFVQKEINPDSHIRGVYGFFAIRDKEEIPFYIGKSLNIFSRLFTGHIYNYLRGVRNTDVQQRMENFLGKGYTVEVRILKRVEYKGDSFIQDANRLALAELEEILKQQDNGYCKTTDQISEAVKKEYEEREWNHMFEKQF